ncbi:MAG: Mth938-like domain-containing protein [Rhodospirillaceae bacterium]|nr:Mth938-like domain-containing protein [Rhodospirillaceae bacterium]
MELSSTLRPAGRTIDAYVPGGFRVGGERLAGSLLLLPDATLRWEVAAVGDITAENLAPACDVMPPVDMLLIGCGERMALLPAGLRQMLRGRGLTVDLMGTPAACRTFNVLISENRRVAAALIAL